MDDKQIGHIMSTLVQYRRSIDTISCVLRDKMKSKKAGDLLKQANLDILYAMQEIELLSKDKRKKRD